MKVTIKEANGRVIDFEGAGEEILKALGLLVPHVPQPVSNPYVVDQFPWNHPSITYCSNGTNGQAPTGNLGYYEPIVR